MQQAAPLLNDRNRNHRRAPSPPPQQQQQQPRNHNNNNNTNVLFRLLHQIYTILRLVLFVPINYLLNRIFPFSELDGLAPAVTAKAAQQCISHLQSLAQAVSNNNNNNNNNNTVSMGRIGTAWCPLGFIALKQEAQDTQSILVLYIHSPIHSDTNEFCMSTLNSEPFLSFIQQDRILAVPYSIHTAQGAQLQNILQITTFPSIVVLQPTLNTSTGTSSSSSQLQLLIKAQGKKQCQLSSLMPYLHAIYQRHLTTINEIEIRKIQRQQEQELRSQQDMEYQATLAADQERERIMAQERDAILTAAALQQEEERTIERQAANVLQEAKNLLRPEPDTTTSSTTTMIRFVLPSGSKINRRFYADETVASLRAYLHIYFVEQQSSQQQQMISNIGLSTNFPRQTFNDTTTTNDDGDDTNGTSREKTLQELGLVPQAVLMVQDLDA